MPSGFVAMTLRRFGAVARESGAHESKSGAGVHAVRTADGLDAYVKVTPVALGPRALMNARRELSFYRALAPAAPLRTPGLLDFADSDDGVALLLAAAGAPLPVTSWTPNMWAALGRDLAALHSMPGPADPGWLSPDELSRAVAEPDLPMVEAFWRPVLPQLGEILARRAELAGWMGALPPAFVHGDCHTDNIMHVRDSLVFLDWASAGLGRPGSDLAFLNVRATPAGCLAPPELLRSYLGGRPGEHRAWRLALLAEELAVFLFQWPAFAPYNSAVGIDRVRRRTRALAEQWLDGSWRDW